MKMIRTILIMMTKGQKGKNKNKKKQMLNVVGIAIDANDA